MYNISIGPFLNHIVIKTIEHNFPSSENIYVHILSWFSLILIYLTNGFLIYFIKKQASKTALDYMVMIDSILCICNSIQIINGVILHYEYFSYQCYFFPFFAFFISAINRLLDMGIVVYRYVHVLKPSMVQGTSRRNTFEISIFLMIFTTSAVLTGYTYYFMDNYMLYYCK